MLDEIKDEFIKFDSMFYLRRTLVTPTILIVVPQDRSETNRVIRNKKVLKEYFIRTTLVSDKK